MTTMNVLVIHTVLPTHDGEICARMITRSFLRANDSVDVVSVHVDDAYSGEPSDYAVVFDPALLGTTELAALASDAVVIVNAPWAPCHRMPGATRVHVIDATAIAERHGLGRSIASAMLGAFVGTTGIVSIDDVLAAVATERPSMTRENIAACAEAFEDARPHAFAA
jgi:Pyruvate/2-oxoacid:ferredoxin oxidoreductase gamma subunit